jgi:hypothetical protein
MSKSLTPRLKLTKESDDEYIDPYAYNWPILDKYAGGLLVADGTTPTDADLYHGCLVSELTSGKQWIAYRDINTGTFTKKWLVYPWFAEVGTPSIGVPVGAFTTNPFGYTNFWRGYNSSAADLVGTKLKMPIDAVYELHYSARGSANATDAVTSCYLSVNDDADYPWTETEERYNANYTVNCCQQMRYLKAGDLIHHKMWQSYSATWVGSITLSASVVCPA